MKIAFTDVANVHNIIPIGSVWESFVYDWRLHDKPVYDGIVRIDEHDERTTFFTYGYDHKNALYESRLLGNRADWYYTEFITDEHGPTFYRDSDNGINTVRTFFIRTDVDEYEKRVPVRVPVANRWNCSCKHGPLADGFPENFS